MRRRDRSRGWPPRLLALAVAAAVWLATAGPAQATGSSPPVTDWIRKHATPLATIDPDAPSGNLAAIRQMVGDAVIVGLGESTHGAREQFLLKHRVLRFLVEEMGFRSIAWEEDWTIGRQLNRYLLTGEGDLDALVQKMSTTWRSPEVAGVLRWLREYNTGHSDKVRFVGVEFFATGHLAYDAVADYVASTAPDRLPALKQHLQPIRPRTEDIQQHVGWYMRQPDKQPYIRHARQVYELVKGLPHAKGDRTWELVLQHTRQILAFYQYFSMGVEGLDYRDERSANTLRWWRQRTGDKVVWWAAGVHTANAPGLQVSFPPTPLARWDSAGSHLRRWYGEKYRSVGFTFDHGSVNSAFGQPPFTPQPFPVPRPPRDWAERPLGDVNLEQYILDLRGDAPEAVRAWLHRPTTTRVIGPTFDPDHPENYYMTGGSLAQWFDVIVHRQEVTPWQPL